MRRRWRRSGARDPVSRRPWRTPQGGSDETLIADFDKRPELTLVSRRPWFDRDKHGEISAYRLSIAP
jgi:hypothetical protein